MRKPICSSVAGAALLTFFCLFGAPAWALSALTFVSGKGADSGNCASPESPCRTFQYAQSQTRSGGEIKALDPANYTFVTIEKSITITGVEGAGIVRLAAKDAITINAGVSDRIVLRNLTLDGSGVATNGIVINSARSVEIINCVTRGFLLHGIKAQPSAGLLNLVVLDSLASNNGSNGIVFEPSGSGKVSGFVKRATLVNNLTGLSVIGRSEVTVVDSAAAGNPVQGFVVALPGATLSLVGATSTANGDGLNAQQQGVARTTRSTFTDNNIGIKIFDTISKVESFRDNVIRHNSTDISGGALVSVDLQ